ncbi:WD40/YVTN/BNR-like repeat-containing protein [Paraburkholderia sp. 40]|uniref:WD40/YVTN/BNR-like repeat-containing protein n=1 Tax=Paraburkholderia sp. 40 TaxID=2991059 RepID=UPI003D1A466A
MMVMRRLYRLAGSASPFIIIGGLLYAGLFIKPEPKGNAVPRPPFERSDRLYGTAVQPDGKIWLVGNNGKILDSMDAARTWQYANDPARVALQDVAAWDDRSAIAVGDDGVALITDDGGKSWKPVDTPKSKIANKLMRVKTEPDGHAIAVGEGGVIVRSTDYGRHWVSVRSEEDEAWNDVGLRDGHGWIVGERGRILLSNDDGRSWREVTSPLKSSLMSVSFKSAKDGVAVGLNGVILASHDGGQTWVQKPFELPDQPQAGGSPQTSDGSTTLYQRGRTEHLLCVVWDGERWIAAGTKGVIAVGDADGDHWRGTRLTPDDRHWYTAIVPYRGRYLLSGSRFVSFPMNGLKSAAVSEKAGEHA